MNTLKLTQNYAPNVARVIILILNKIILILFSASYSFDSMSWPDDTVPEWVRAVVCYGWHSQGIYYVLYTCSIYNNVLFSGERLVAIVFPFKLLQFTSNRYRVTLFVGRVPSALQIFKNYALGKAKVKSVIFLL